MAQRGAAQPDTPTDLAKEAADLAAETGSLRNHVRDLHKRAAILRDKLSEAGIGFVEDDNTTARQGEGDHND